VFSDHFYMLMSIFFLKNKNIYYFNMFLSEKYFEKQTEQNFKKAVIFIHTNREANSASQQWNRLVSKASHIGA